MSSWSSFLKKVTTVWSFICLTSSSVGSPLPKKKFLFRARTSDSQRKGSGASSPTCWNSLGGLASLGSTSIGEFSTSFRSCPSFEAEASCYSTTFIAADFGAGFRDSLTTFKFSGLPEQFSSSALAAKKDLVDLEGFFLEPPDRPSLPMLMRRTALEVRRI